MRSRYESSSPAGCPFTTKHALNAFVQCWHDLRRCRRREQLTSEPLCDLANSGGPGDDGALGFITCVVNRFPHSVDPCPPSTEGLAIAIARIADEKKNRTGFLDLGRLGLTDVPEELFELEHLRGLNWGLHRPDGQGSTA